MAEHIISNGERWTVEDILDASTIVSFDSWNSYEPEARAREVFVVYPRMARLWRERVVKYEREEVAVHDFISMDSSKAGNR